MMDLKGCQTARALTEHSFFGSETTASKKWKDTTKENSDLTSTSAQTDPNGLDPHAPGAKLDAGKPCGQQGLIEYFPRALEMVSAISTFGASKYSWGGWRTVDDGINRYSNAKVRHALSEAKGEFFDPESGYLHAGHEAWNALARLELMLRELEANGRDGQVQREGSTEATPS